MTRRAAVRSAACVALLASCTPEGARAPSASPAVSPASPAPAVSPASPASPAAVGGLSCAHDGDVEAEVAGIIERTIRADDPVPDARVVTVFECPRLAAPRWIAGLRAQEDRGTLELLDVSAEVADRADVRRVTLPRRERPPAVDGPPPAVAFAHATVTGERARHALAFARAALAARVARVAPQPPKGTGSWAATGASESEEVDLRTTAVRAEELERQWQGGIDSEGAPERVPIEIAFAALSDLLPADAVARDVPDRELVLAEGWASMFPHTPWVGRRLLDLTAVLGTRAAMDHVFPALASPSEEERVLAVRAAAALTRRDFVHDGKGTVRPLAAIVADYRELAGRRPESW